MAGLTGTKLRTLLCVLLLIGGITMLWFRKGKPAMEFRTVDLPGSIGSVSIPRDFVVEMEDDSTLLAYPRASVQKRIESKQPEFFQDVYLAILDQLKHSE